MILALLQALADPDAHAVTFRNGEIYLAPITDLEARGIVVRVPTRGSRGTRAGSSVADHGTVGKP